jgi:hypothetical protein
MAWHYVQQGLAANVPKLKSTRKTIQINPKSPQTFNALSIPPLITNSAVSLKVTAVTWNLFTLSKPITGPRRRKSWI